MTNPELPPELIAHILLDRYREPSVCAFHLLAPDWGICNRRHRTMQKALKIARIDTYTVPESGLRGTISSAFDHGEDDHLFMPMVENPRDLEDLGPFFHRELLRNWVSDSLIVVDQQKPHLGPLWIPNISVDKIFRDDDALQLIPYGDDGYQVGCVEDGSDSEFNFSDEPQLKLELPSLRPDEPPRFCFEHIRHLMFNTSPEVMELEPLHVCTMPISTSLGPNAQNTLDRVEAGLWLERRACLDIQWWKMDRLELLFLDLRSYSNCPHGGLEAADIATLAHTLSSTLGRPLKLLVIAGLRSYSLYPPSRPLDIEEVEGGIENKEDPDVPVMEDKSVDRVNWFLMFRNAVQPGGKLIFVDRRYDVSYLPTWRVP